MRERYIEELRKLNASIISMGRMIEIAIESSMLALMGRDKEAAKEVGKNDEFVNGMERDIEALCMKLLLQQQPMATDLRLITAALKMVTDMERIGDHAVDVADLVLNVPDCKYGKMNEITEMSTQIIQMLHDAVQSYIEKDYSMAKNVIAHDDVIDSLYHTIKKDLVEKIRQTDEGETILDYLLIAKYIERIGDHATNIAEWVIYALTGERE
ncbi:MAG: phosphate signaling complex protein PhoU [Treponema sp.]|nr:phosphate signaling complex protein PhoU [Treponema sp.]